MAKNSRNAAAGGRFPWRALLFAAVIAACAAAAAGIAYCWNAGARAWRNQCRIEEMELDAVFDGTWKMVPQEAIPIIFGLTNGANLAEIDFARLRADALKRYPAIKDVKIERRMPNRVTISVLEREPIVRVGGGRRQTAASGRVADDEGVVFRFAAQSAGTLPLVREDPSHATPPGGRLKGNAAAAVTLVKSLADSPLDNFGVLEADASHPDWLLVTISDSYARAKLAWNHMGEGTRREKESMREQLRNLDCAIASGIAQDSPSVLWIATDWEQGRIYASSSAKSGDDPGRRVR